jgi:hypothetical protein
MPKNIDQDIPRYYSKHHFQTLSYQVVSPLNEQSIPVKAPFKKSHEISQHFFWWDSTSIKKKHFFGVQKIQLSCLIVFFG